MKRLAFVVFGLFVMANAMACYHHTKEVVVEHPDHGWHDDHHDDHHDWDHH
jgi:hypothetical protein